jgi:glycolate oxidase
MAVTGAIHRDDRSIEEVAKLRQTAASELIKVVGPRWVKNDPQILDTYTWQYIAELTTGTNYMERPLAIVMPANTEEVAGVVKVCNDLGCQYKAFSTGFGMWCAPTRPDFVVQIDLRRLDRIIKIDKKNMVAVIEPYVTGNQLQTEAMKVGLNTHITGAGGQTSILASATSVMGQGWDGISMGFSNRNLLGVEWVLPDGTIAQLGSFESSGEYFSGDGPGFSLRGAMRGFAGTMGGLGVFTKAAVKLYPWYGPEKVVPEGISPNYFTEIPRNNEAGMLIVNNWDEMADLGYQLGEAEIMDYVCRNAPCLMSAVMVTDNNEFERLYRVPFLQNMQYSLLFVIVAQDEDDYNYRMKTLKKIVKDLRGGLMLSGTGLKKAYWMLRTLRCVAKKAGVMAIVKSLPGTLSMIRGFVKRFGPKGLDYISNMGYEAMTRSGFNMRGIFRFGGTFHTALGALISWDSAIRGAKIGEQIKHKYIDDGVLFDDGGDNAWGGLYEGGAYSHLEELGAYDPTDSHCREYANDYCIDCNLACIDYTLGDNINAMGPPNHLLFSPACWNYDNWQQKIKAALDPNNASDASFYTDPEFEKNPPQRVVEGLRRVKANRAKVVIP